MKENLIMRLSFKFALEIIPLYKNLIKDKEFIISKQLLRSATSIGANVYEASAAASRKDFINKMTLASKEARETYFWLKVLDEGTLVDYHLPEYLRNVKDIMNVLTAIIKTSHKNLKAKR